jgi:putative DNA primase/helicase
MDIPKNLHNKDFRFTLLRGKIPIEKDWQKDNNYTFYDDKLKKHKDNIGVICGKGNLFVIDIDGNGENTLNKLLEKLPETYIVKTGKQGFHMFYVSDELISGTAFNFNDSHIDIKADRGQVVMEGSTHPETKKKYTCFMDKPITFVKKKDFEEVFEIKQKNGFTHKQKEKTIDDDKSRSAKEYTQVCSMISKGKTKEEIFSFMSAFEKWKSSPDSYKEYTYNKAFNFIESSKNEPLSDENIKYKILELLCDTNKDTKSNSYIEAEELMVNHLIKKYHFRTIQQDEKTEVWGYKEGIYINIGQSLAREELRKILGRAFSQRIVNRVIDKLTADTYIDYKRFFKNEDPYLLPVKNGLLDLKTGELKEFTPDKIFFSKLPIEYDKEAKCNYIIKHLENVLPHKNDVLLLQEAIGNCLYKKYSFQKAVMLVGSGRNGKGITLQLLTRLLGAENTSAVTLEQLENDIYSMSGLHGKLANIGGDLNKTSLKNTGNFKTLSGGDLINAPRKFMTPISFENHAKFFFACNELPLIYDNSRGFWDRWLYFEFPYTFITQEEYAAKEEKKNFKIADPLLKEKLFNDEELKGFLNWAYEGLKRLLDNNSFSQSDTFESVKRKWINQSDSFKAFCELHVEQDYTSQVDKRDLKLKYYNYCKDNQINPLTDKHIYKILTTDYGADVKQIVEDFTGTKTRVWEGIKLK